MLKDIPNGSSWYSMGVPMTVISLVIITIFGLVKSTSWSKYMTLIIIGIEVVRSLSIITYFTISSEFNISLILLSVFLNGFFLYMAYRIYSHSNLPSKI